MDKLRLTDIPTDWWLVAQYADEASAEPSAAAISTRARALVLALYAAGLSLADIGCLSRLPKRAQLDRLRRRDEAFRNLYGAVKRHQQHFVLPHDVRVAELAESRARDTSHVVAQRIKELAPQVDHLRRLIRHDIFGGPPVRDDVNLDACQLNLQRRHETPPNLSHETFDTYGRRRQRLFQRQSTYRLAADQDPGPSTRPPEDSGPQVFLRRRQRLNR